MASDTSQRYDLTWQVTPDMLGILTSSGHFEATNPAWFATLGYSAQEIESREFFDFVHPDDHAATKQAFLALQRGEPVLQFENRFRHKDGNFRWLSWNCVPEGGKYYCSARDVTDGKSNAAALLSSEAEAVLREQFIAVLGHDLRNPLAAVEAGLGMLGREQLSDRGRGILAESQRSSRRMFALIDDLMDFARTRLGSGLSLDLALSSDLREALADVAQEITSGHSETPIVIDIVIDGPVYCDVARLSQMTSNLLANAVTHGDNQRVVLRARGSGEQLEISVTNSGGAIPPEVRPHLFEPFVRERVRSSQEGLGLGLFICSEIARAHGGRIFVESAEGETSFTFRMPVPGP